MTEPTIRVALVDDDPSVRRALTRLLRSVGFEVKSYDCVKAFLRDFTAANTADCAIVDVRMPGETGLALAEFVRAAAENIPVILMTGDADATLAERAARCGAFALLGKPVQIVLAISWCARSLLQWHLRAHESGRYRTVPRPNIKSKSCRNSGSSPGPAAVVFSSKSPCQTF